MFPGGHFLLGHLGKTGLMCSADTTSSGQRIHENYPGSYSVCATGMFDVCLGRQEMSLMGSA